MPNTFTKIASVTVGSGGTASIGFTGIPSIYADLCLKLSARSDRVANQDAIIYKFNSTTTNYSYRQLFGGAGGGSIVTGSASGTPAYQVLGIFPATNNTANTFGNQELYIPNYAGSTNKSTSSDSVSENNAATHFQLDLIAGLLANSSAITSITIYSENAANLVQYTTATLYGIKSS